MFQLIAHAKYPIITYFYLDLIPLEHSVLYGTKIWNNILHEIRNLPYTKFKSCYEKYVLEKYA